jgi:hypothetical protein
MICVWSAPGGLDLLDVLDARDEALKARDTMCVSSGERDMDDLSQ